MQHINYKNINTEGKMINTLTVENDTKEFHNYNGCYIPLFQSAVT